MILANDKNELVHSNGWIPLEKWASMTETDWKTALAYANQKSKRTSKTFHAADVDRSSNQDIKVWYQAPNIITGFRRPRLVPRNFNPSIQDD
jgi:hypothetical protein